MTVRIVFISPKQVVWKITEKMINRRRHQSLINFLRVRIVLIVPKQVVVVVAVADVVSNRSNFYGR